MKFSDESYVSHPSWIRIFIIVSSFLIMILEVLYLNNYKNLLFFILTGVCIVSIVGILLFFNKLIQSIQNKKIKKRIIQTHIILHIGWIQVTSATLG